jgi:hypothetical protein
VTVGCCPVRSWDCRLRVVSAFGLCADSTRARGLRSVSFPGLKGFLPQGFLHRASVTVGVVLLSASAFPLSRYARALVCLARCSQRFLALARFWFRFWLARACGVVWYARCTQTPCIPVACVSPRHGVHVSDRFMHLVAHPHARIIMFF